jgi:hypothetical protein
MVTKADEYAFGSGAPGSLLRETRIAYATDIGNIFDLPSSVQVFDGADLTTPVAKTTYGYDEASPAASGITTQHTSVTCPPGYTKCRGNRTTATYTVQGSTTMSRTFAYYDTGALKSWNDLNGPNNPTTYTYGAGDASCQGAFPTQVVLPITTLSRSMAWNCNGGVMTSETDENGKVTSTTYNDANLWRPTSISYPDNGVTTITYNTSSAPWSISGSSKKDSTTNLTVESDLDSLGRINRQQLTSDPNGTAYVDTTYDSNGRTASVTNPYYTTGDPTYGVTLHLHGKSDTGHGRGKQQWRNSDDQEDLPGGWPRSPGFSL